MKEKHICCICGKEFEGYGNNPMPVTSGFKEDGQENRCCDECNDNVVLPARILQYQVAESKKGKEE